ncbi:hypothetical protein LTS08_003982 [Lithohypha guttulata]|nr:hypothetical protein LTS08_003982 [Lithohypha guttulata]
MLASLFRGTSGQSKSQYIESVTDDAHTRSLLFGQSQHVFNLSASLPPSPFGSPPLRLSSFDDQAGLELEEKDIRILLAQDAYGGDDRPTLLFDSFSPEKRTDGQGVIRSPLPAEWRPEELSRNRSSTFSGNQSSWTRPSKDLPAKDDPFLECMFGVQTSAKTNSATKLHIVPAHNRKWNASERGPRKTSDNSDQRRRAPLARAHTSSQQITLSSLDVGGRDALLVTRLFHVPLDETIKIANTKSTMSPMLGQDKPPKLVERRVPAFAIGLVLYLPHPTHRPHSSHSRKGSKSGYGHSHASEGSSVSSETRSWTFLDAMPASLSSSVAAGSDEDQRVDMVVDNWDIVLRCLFRLQNIGQRVVTDELHKILLHQADEPRNKSHKERSMQRSNQRILAIHNAHAVARSPLMATVSVETSKRIVYALRIPRVITGLGFTAGHWIDEARMLYRSCGGKQQGVFLFSLLTAFLGSNMQWLERLAPEWYRKQYQANHKKPEDVKPLIARTIIVSDHKGLARRLIYILASFLPGRTGIDRLARLGEESLGASSSSPFNHSLHAQSSGRRRKPYMRNAQPTPDQAKEFISTSATSQTSLASAMINRSPRRQLSRKDSNKFDIGGDGIRTMIQGGSGTSSAIVPQAVATPMAHISVRDGYFSESAIVDTNDSIASADLSKMLSRAASSHRRTSSVSSRLSSFVSGLSGIWSNKQSTSGDRYSTTTFSQDSSPVHQHKRSSSSAVPINRNNPLQIMVDELEQNNAIPQELNPGQYRDEMLQRTDESIKLTSAAPRLHVDQQDGVIDVELDLPGFMSATSLSPPQHYFNRKRAKSPKVRGDGSDSFCSSMTMASGKRAQHEHINVGGYLRRHHEDFVLHAVRPYNDLQEDIRRVLHAEPTPHEVIEKLSQDTLSSCWIPVCTTLVADTRLFSIHKLTLRRQYEVSSSRPTSGTVLIVPNGSTNSFLSLKNEEIADEVVLGFDATLAKAIEKLLNVTPDEASGSGPSTRTHSRNVSVGTTSSTRASGIKPASPANPPPEVFKAEQQDLVAEALEEVVRSVDEALNKTEPKPAQNTGSRQDKGLPQQENALREGVRKWMIDVEHTSVW